MKYFVVLFFLVISITAIGQVKEPSQKVNGIIISNTTKEPLSGVNIINVNKVRGATTDLGGYFELDVQVNDTLLITNSGFQ